MIVDDDEDVITTVKQGLETLTHNLVITGVDSGKKCIDLLEKGNRPDIILLDIMLPEINGWQIYDYLKSKNELSKIPIVFITALDDEKTMKKGMETDAYCIHKPFNIEQLKEMIDSALGIF